jgi:hypothetical protein
MVSVIAIALFLIFLNISLLHFYWSFGGQWGKRAAVPTKNDHTSVIAPGFLSSFIVASGLLGFGLFNLTEVKSLDLPMPPLIKKSGPWVIAIIFLARAVGDFKYIGFFKKIRHTRFGEKDTKFFSPLCLVIGILNVILALNR